MNIILFGPPGIGKSTIIGHLKLLGQKAIDLEDVYPNRIRFQLPSMVHDTIIGAADLNPQRKYHNAISVLLYANQDHYDKRRAQRDSKQPGKASQSKHLIESWMSGKYQFLLDTSNQSPQETASQILSIMKGGHS